MLGEFKAITNYLLEKQCIDTNTLQKAIEAAKNSEQGLIYYLARNNLIHSETLVSIASEIFHLEVIDLSNFSSQKINTELVSLDLIIRFHIIPLEKTETNLKIALCDPCDLKALEILKFHAGLNLKCYLARYDQIDYLIKKISTQHYTDSLMTVEKDQHQSHIETSNQHNDPLIRFVNDMLENAINKGASDIHFEPYENYYRIRFRLDGLLHEISQPPANIAQQLAVRLKIMAKLDIAEHRLPQDGRCKFKSFNNHDIDMRVSSCPTLYGEKVVLRLLNSSDHIRDIDELHFDEQQQKHFQSAIKQSQGLILVTGPTGSGKTVTLYAALKELNTIEKNISTAEDPVEINLPGINQVNVNPKTGLVFSRALRAFLRQDPDIIMIGEIRDLETAEIAIKAAQTGHLVLSTLHTNSALESLTRLNSMGIALHNLTSAISLITAQRLARKLCPFCKRLIKPTTLQSEQFHLTNLYQANGCDKCTDGYCGRIAIHEVIPIDQTISEKLLSNQPISTLIDFVKKRGILTLHQAAIEKVKLGETSLEEVQRVINFTN